ncbi:MAG: ribosome maturation factor RimP [Gammaproteobacteria bacterium]
MSEKRDLKALLAPAVTSLGFELWGVEYLVRGRHRLLRVYIDRDEGVTVDDCAAVSHQVSGVLDVEDPIPGEYTLEVSSPGLDRVLFEPSQYERYAGSLLLVRTQAAIAGRRRFRGRLQSVSGEGFVLALDEGGEQAIAFAAVDKAQIEPEFPNNKR